MGNIRADTKDGGAEHWVSIDDTNIVSYLHYCGFKFSPFKKSDDRVAFRVYGDIDKGLAGYYDNANVGIQDYVACLKKVRGSMFLIKGMQESETEQAKTNNKEE